MANQSSSINTVLWISLGGSVALVILAGFTWPTLIVVALVVASLIYWLITHQYQLRAKYETAEANASLPGRYDQQIWRHKPRLRDVAPGMTLLGLCGFYFAYEAAHGEMPTRLAKLVHQAFGATGVVIFWSVLGSFLLGKGIEVMLGSRLRK